MEPQYEFQTSPPKIVVFRVTVENCGFWVAREHTIVEMFQIVREYFDIYQNTDNQKTNKQTNKRTNKQIDKQASIQTPLRGGTQQQHRPAKNKQQRGNQTTKENTTPQKKQ